jgi:NADPH:quinone reductase-like Zn-dependent oxidoreductase
MRAIAQDRYGAPDVLELRTMERPTPAEHHVLIEVEAAGVDRGVWHLVTGMPYIVRLAGFGLTRPKQPVPGMDVSGRVVAVGSAVRRFQVGDAVFGIGTGTFAEYAVADEAKLAHRPAGVDAETAAVTAISGITALQALRDAGRVRRGQRVLVLGAAGGVGSFAVQLACHMGATVTGVASGPKLELVRSLGAERAIDYTTTDALDGSQRYDLIIDTGGRRPVRRLRKALARRGTLVIVGGEDGGRITGGFGRQLRALALSPFVRQRLTTFVSAERGADIEELAELLASGDLRPVVDRRYALEDASRAIVDLADGWVRGKAVIRVQG